MRDRPRTPATTLQRARSIGLAGGLHHVYTGNVSDKRTQSTYCHACGGLLIGRDWYVLEEWNLEDGGLCGRCGARCAGLFEAEAGVWGPRRLPVRLANYQNRVT